MSNYFEILQNISENVCLGVTSEGLVEGIVVAPVDDLVQIDISSALVTSSQVQKVTASDVFVEDVSSSLVEAGSTHLVVDPSVQASVGIPPVIVTRVEYPVVTPLRFPDFDDVSGGKLGCWTHLLFLSVNPLLSLQNACSKTVAVSRKNRPSQGFPTIDLLEHCFMLDDPFVL